MRRAARLLLAGLCGAGWWAPGEARAAFELRDASPASLGAATLDREPAPMIAPAAQGESAAPGETPAPGGEGIRAGASVSRFLSAAEIEVTRLELAAEGARRSVACSVTQVGAVFARETALRIAVRETASRGIALEVCGERLDLRVEGEPSRGGWAVGGRALATVPAGRLDVTLDLGCDRLLRSEGLGALAVAPSLPFAISLRGPTGAVTYVDRWEADGARSPRVVLDLALGRALLLRLARGSDPARTGIAVALRLGRLEVAAGHLDLDSGIGLAGASVQYRVFAPRRGGNRAARSGALLL